jgi:hypothetical protein
MGQPAVQCAKAGKLVHGSPLSGRNPLLLSSCSYTETETDDIANMSSCCTLDTGIDTPQERYNFQDAEAVKSLHGNESLSQDPYPMRFESPF